MFKPLFVLVSLVALVFFRTALGQLPCQCSDPVEIGTFNTFQDEFSARRTERLPAQIDFLRNSTLDVVCLQELWDRSVKSSFINDLNSVFPFNATGPDSPTVCVPECSEEEVRDITSCFLAQCSSSATGEVAALGCIVQNCISLPRRLSDRCESCLGIRTGISLRSKLDRCGGLVRVQEDPDLWSSCRPIFNGSADNVILSKFPITQSDFLKFTFAPIWATNVVYAKIQPPGWPSPLNVFCTHLAPEVPLFNFQETNLAQARQLLDFVRQKVPNQNETIVILGDFNSGPEIDRLDVDDTFPRTYELIRQNSFIDTLTLTSNRQATRDEERNRFADKTEMIDHIFVLQPNATASIGGCVRQSSTFATESVRVNSDSIPLSDHFGVLASICPPTL